jgi:hypothetical protein
MGPRHATSRLLAVALLAASHPASAAPPSCTDVQGDPTLLACSCVQDGGSGNPTLVPIPDRCADMLGGERMLVRADDLVLAQPDELSANPVEWVSQNTVYQTKALAANPDYGDFDSTGTTYVVNHPACSVTGAPSTPQRTRMGRLFDTPNDFLVTLSSPDDNDAQDCNPGDGSTNLVVHIRDVRTGQTWIPMHVATAAVKFAQLAVADFDLDGFDDIAVVTVDKIVIATASDPSTPGVMTVHETALDLAHVKPLNEPTAGDFNGDGRVDLAWIGGNFDASNTSERGQLTVAMATVCPGDVAGDPVCAGAQPFAVVRNPALALAPGVAGATSDYTLDQLPGAAADSATLTPNNCSAWAGGSGGPLQSLRAGAVVLGDFVSGEIGAGGLPVDELIVAYVSGTDSKCSVDVWLFQFRAPSSTSPSWASPVDSERNLFPELVILPVPFPNGAAVVALFAQAARLDWLGAAEQAVITIGGGAGYFFASNGTLDILSPSYIVPVTVSVSADDAGDLAMEVCASPDRSENTPGGSEGETGTRYLWGAAVGRFTTTEPAAGDTVCSDPDAAGVCPFDLQLATYGAEFDGFTGTGNEMKLWAFEPSNPSGSSSQKCANAPNLRTPFLPVFKRRASVSSLKLARGWDKAGSMLQVGDPLGNSMRLGQPTVVRVSGQAQPIAIIQAPPTHIDYVVPVDDDEPHLLNLSAAPEDFNTSYQDATSSSEGATHQRTISSSLSNTETIGTKFQLSETPLDTVTVQDQMTFTEAEQSTTNKSIGQYESQSFSLNASTGIRDAVRWQTMSMNVFHYPILGSASCPGSIVCSAASANAGEVVCGDDVAPVDAIVLTCALDSAGAGCECRTAQAPTVTCPSTPSSPDATACSTDAQGNACCAQQTTPLNYVLSGPQVITEKMSPGSVLEWYQPPHASGQFFSYPASLALAQARFGRAQGTALPPANNMTRDVAFDTGSGAATESTQWSCSNQSNASYGTTSNFSYDNSLSMTFGSNDEVFKTGSAFQANVGWDIGYSSSHSTLNTSTVTHVASSGIQTNIVRDRFLTPLEDYSYGFTPFLFGADKPPTVLDDPPTSTCPVDDVDCDAAQKLPTDCSQTGPMVVGYSAAIDEQQSSWWGETYASVGAQNGFDLALANPERWQITTTTTVDSDEQFRRCRGTQPACASIQGPSTPPADPENPTPQEVNAIWTNSYYSLRGLLPTVNSTLGPQRSQASVGDTVFLRLRVYNYSLAPVPAGVTAYARFYRQQVDPTFDATGDVIGLQRYVGAPVVIMDGQADAVAFPPPPAFSSAGENFVLVEVSYPVDATQADSYWIFWTTVWLEDAEGNVVSELANHGLGSGFSPSIHYRTISQVPLAITADGSFTNNVGMWKQTFYVAPETPALTGMLGHPRADRLSIEGLEATPALPRPFAPVEVGADVYSHGAATSGVTVLISEKEPASADLVLDVERLPHVRADSSHFVRKAIRPEHCGPFEILVEALARQGLAASATTSFHVPCEPRPLALEGLLKRYGSRAATLDLKARFAKPEPLDLRTTRITIESLLREARGEGELVWIVVARDEPLVLVPAHGARWRKAYFEPERHGKSTRPEKIAGGAEHPAHAKTRVQGEHRGHGKEGKHGDRDDLVTATLERIRDGLELRLRVPRSSISAPGACGGRPSETILETSLLLDDGRGSPQRLVFGAPWNCSRKGNRLSLRYESDEKAPGSPPGKPFERAAGRR